MGVGEKYGYRNTTVWGLACCVQIFSMLAAIGVVIVGCIQVRKVSLCCQCTAQRNIQHVWCWLVSYRNHYRLLGDKPQQKCVSGMIKCFRTVVNLALQVDSVPTHTSALSYYSIALILVGIVAFVTESRVKQYNRIPCFVGVCGLSSCITAS